MPTDTPPLALVDELLRSAQSILDGHTGLPIRQRSRAAALLARTALELIVDLRLVAAGFAVDRANTRTKLITYRVAVEPGHGPAVDVAYAGLSRACHQHAYELAPSNTEIRHLLCAVGTALDDLLAGVGSRTPR